MVVLTNFPPPTVGIRHQEANTAAHIETKDLGKGTLFITESNVFWVGNNGQGFSLEYPTISLHAISRDPNTFPHECLYLMIDTKLDEQNQNSGNATTDGEEEDGIKVSEIRFIPDNKSILDSMFRVMADCQALHPDPPDSASDDGYDDEDEEDEAEYDVSEAERQYGPGDQDYNTEEPMDLCQFEDAEPEH